MSKEPCQTCRARHLKCDRVLPTCDQCQRSERTCVPSFNVRFRRGKVAKAADKGFHVKGKLTFSPDQQWVETPRSLSFVDEFGDMGDLVKLSSRNDACETDRGASSPCPAPAEEDHRRNSGSDDEREDSIAGSSRTAVLAGLSPEQTDNTEPVNDRMSDIDQASIDLPLSSHSFLEEDIMTPDINPIQTNEITPEYTRLLHYFKVAIGWPWFDITDPGFTMEALSLAPKSPLLLYSMLATACIHKSRSESAQDIAFGLAVQAESLHEKCISILLPMIQEKHLITNGAFLTCSTILRFYEEISAPVHGRDDARHLLGGSASVAEFHNQELAFDGLSRAAFWVHLRQDTVVAIINRRVPRMNLNFPDLISSFDQADAFSWTKRATWIHAEVVEFCFGSDVNSTHRFEYITHELEGWDQCKSDIFTPSYYQTGDPVNGRFFPDICFTLDIAALGLSYHFLSMLLMAIYDPTIPRMGPEYLEGRRRTKVAILFVFPVMWANLDKNRVLHYLRLLCGLAWSNPVPPARATTSLAISQCGCWVSDAKEQDAMINTLQMIESDDIWPTASAQDALHGQWEQDKNETF